MAEETHRLILHIGANKTGSTAIQEFLGLNAPALAELGWVVAPSDLTPAGAVTGHQAPFLDSLLGDIPAGAALIEERLDALMAPLPEGAHLLISAESLSNPGNGSCRLFARVSEKYQARVIVYIRRPDEFVLSTWRQWYNKTNDDFWAWIVYAAGRRCNWRWIIEPWEAVVPRARIEVRIYDRARLHKRDVVADFLQLLGIDEDAHAFQRPAGAINPSYSGAVMDLVRGNPLLFKDMHDDDTFRVIDQLTGDRFHRRPRESELTFEQRVNLLQKYDDANNWVKNAYFPDLDGPLFTPPQPGDYDTPDPERLKAEKWDLAGALLYGLAKKVL